MEFTHYAVCSADFLDKNETLHKKGKVNYLKLIHAVNNEGFFAGKNLDLFHDRLIFYLDNGNQVTLYLHTIH
jgi:hypothetical protein